MAWVGIAVWGARTLAGADGVQSDYKYVPVRRLALYLEDSLYSGLEWVVFEPNGEDLWRAVQRPCLDLLTILWRSGAFQGTTAKDAFFVRCDRTTMTQQDIENGRLIVEIGFAPAAPSGVRDRADHKAAGQRTILQRGGKTRDRALKHLFSEEATQSLNRIPRLHCLSSETPAMCETEP